MQLKPAAAGQPCARPHFSRRLGRRLPLRPAVDCLRDCAACPWNPAEKARRLAQGDWRRDKEGLLGLCFPPAAKESPGIPARKGEDKP